VDDSAVMRAIIIKTMHISGLPLGEIYQAANGKEGLDSLSQHWIDLVIADINMPVMNGEEMINCMLENPDSKDIPTDEILSHARGCVEFTYSKKQRYSLESPGSGSCRGSLQTGRGIRDQGYLAQPGAGYPRGRISPG